MELGTGMVESLVMKTRTHLVDMVQQLDKQGQFAQMWYILHAFRLCC